MSGEVLTDEKIKERFGEFQRAYSDAGGSQWRDRYVAHVMKVRNASTEEWHTSAFQESLWNSGAIANIGPGASVTVAGAYTDGSIADFLLRARDGGLHGSPEERVAQLQILWDELLAHVYPRHTDRRPRARIVRLFAALFPEDMTCLMDARRVWQVQALIGAPRCTGEFIGQHPLLRARLRDALGTPEHIEGAVEQSMFTWFLWETKFGKPELGAVETIGVGREPIDLPELSLLPAASQRRSLFSIQNNVGLLVSVVRETEQGIGREDLIRVIMQEAPHLAQTSAANVINQALGGGLGVIRFSEGAYYPTDRGLELLSSTKPGHVLRAPLIGHVFGVGHLLLALSRRPDGASQKEMTAYVQGLVPTWTTSQPASYIVQWAKLTELVRTDARPSGTQLFLTDDGQDYAAALPKDFEVRWRVQASEAEPVESLESETLSAPPADLIPASAAVKTPYDVDSIIAEGCFLRRDEIADVVDLLKRKKNLILQGPPGTGKTWLAKRLGYALLGVRDPSRVIAVQFQPSLSYEDFVRGWRPDGQGGLRLADGLFLEGIKAARGWGNDPFVFVIEEINRGNPAQIFGELLTLLETDKRREEEGLQLAYPRDLLERVHIPPNLHVIGTMNLADRSLALVDLALRRRFAFLTLRPNLGDAWRNWCAALGAPESLVDQIATRMRALNSVISSDQRLRDQFCVGHSFVTPPNELGGASAEKWRDWFVSVVRTEIVPLLEEYWYDDQDTAQREAKCLLQGL
jgi:5-methylcytosine-specific restriction protein B